MFLTLICSNYNHLMKHGFLSTHWKTQRCENLNFSHLHTNSVLRDFSPFRKVYIIKKSFPILDTNSNHVIRPGGIDYEHLNFMQSTMIPGPRRKLHLFSSDSLQELSSCLGPSPLWHKSPPLKSTLVSSYEEKRSSVVVPMLSDEWLWL